MDNKNFTLIEGDFLKETEKIKKVINQKKINKIKILGNLPYHITTPILDKIFTTPTPWDLFPGALVESRKQE